MNVSRETVRSKPAGLAHDVSRETSDRLEAHAALILEWNSRINLVARGDESSLWERHVEDSLQLAPLVPAWVDRIIDLGSGAGFPGLVLAIATGIRVDLVESDLRKAAFLREAIRATGANAAVCPRRVEACGLSPAKLVTARALAPLSKLLGLAHPLLTPDGVCLFPKGRRVAEELAEARHFWTMQIEPYPSGLDPESSILRISGLRHV